MIRARARLRAGFSPQEVIQLWSLLNDRCFDSKLKKPIIVLDDQQGIEARVEDFIEDWGLANAEDRKGGSTLGLVLWDFKRSLAVIVLSKSLTSAHDLMHVLAHEMVHQALAEKHGYQTMCRIGHGPQFSAYQMNIERYPGLTLLGANFTKIPKG